MELRYQAGRSVRHAAGAMTEAALVVAIAAALVFAFSAATGQGPAGAGKALARTTSGTISLASAGSRLAASTVPSLGDVVTFDVTVSSNVNNPRVELMCYQDGNVVYGETGSIGQARGDGTDSLGYNGFLLGGGGSYWKDHGGDAHCVAKLFYYGKRSGQQVFVTIDVTSFDAVG